jgi:hypothetical protein
MKKRTKNILALVCIAMVCVADDLVVGPYCMHVNVTSQATELTDDVETIPAVVEEWRDE